MVETGKWCPTCRSRRPVGEFSRDRTRKDGLQSQCRRCCREKTRAHYRRNATSVRAATARHARTNAIQREAHLEVQRAVRHGEVVPGPCEACGAERAEAHHDDYAKPLDVRWLCRSCHVRHHQIVDRIARLAGGHADLLEQLAEVDCG